MRRNPAQERPTSRSANGLVLSQLDESIERGPGATVDHTNHIVSEGVYMLEESSRDQVAAFNCEDAAMVHDHQQRDLDSILPDLASSHHGVHHWPFFDDSTDIWSTAFAIPDNVHRSSEEHDTSTNCVERPSLENLSIGRDGAIHPLTPQSRVSNDADGICERNYSPTLIELDAPLSFPDMKHADLVTVNNEHSAHVRDISQEQHCAMVLIASRLQYQPSYPKYSSLCIPPIHILSAWVQLYFEHFHPIFPVLHPPSFSSPNTPPLLVLAVASIGAQFSRLQNAGYCARAIQELVRRTSSHLVRVRSFIPAYSAALTLSATVRSRQPERQTDMDDTGSGPQFDGYDILWRKESAGGI
jgi:hypothetical protein